MGWVLIFTRVLPIVAGIAISVIVGVTTYTIATSVLGAQQQLTQSFQILAQLIPLFGTMFAFQVLMMIPRFFEELVPRRRETE